MGEVWRGTDTTLGRPVAVKLLKHEYADDATFRSRFETEARHAASLQHPGIAAVFDVGESQASGVADGSGVPRPYLVMELVEGQPLSALLRPGDGLDPDAVRDLLAQAGDAIGAAHRAGIVHRDIKPANLLVTPDRRIKITDFGIARASEGLGLTGTGQVMGTPQYLSPEQARGEVATSASDVYSLGVVAFECLAGRRPFEAESPVATALAHIQQPVPALPGGVPDDLALVVQRALAKKPAERYADGAAFAAALRDPATAATQIVAARRPAGPPVPAPVPVPVVLEDDYTATYDDDGRPPVWPALLVIVLLVVAAIVIVYLLMSSDDSTHDDDDLGILPSESVSSSAPSESPSPTETQRDAGADRPRRRRLRRPRHRRGRRRPAPARPQGRRPADPQPRGQGGRHRRVRVPDERSRRGRHGQRRPTTSSRNRATSPRRPSPTTPPRPTDPSTDPTPSDSASTSAAARPSTSTDPTSEASS